MDFRKIESSQHVLAKGFLPEEQRQTARELTGDVLKM
jgi:hypothetical protein